MSNSTDRDSALNIPYHLIEFEIPAKAGGLPHPPTAGYFGAPYKPDSRIFEMCCLGLLEGVISGMTIRYDSDLQRTHMLEWVKLRKPKLLESVEGLRWERKCSGLDFDALIRSVDLIIDCPDLGGGRSLYEAWKRGMPAITFSATDVRSISGEALVKRYLPEAKGSLCLGRSVEEFEQSIFSLRDQWQGVGPFKASNSQFYGQIRKLISSL